MQVNAERGQREREHENVEADHKDTHGQGA